MGIIKGFTFDGVDSLDYGVGITGSAVYNAPTRDVDMITIPGRNGEYALDHGRFNNIEVTYPAGLGEISQGNFADTISDLRNQLTSRVGYKRLEDEYHPDEYRTAIYKSGLEVNPVQYSRAGEFDIVFDCKPQRFLKSGETAVSQSRNSTITNPTLFDSHPLLQFNSSGADATIGLGTQNITVKSAYVGVTPLNLSVASTTVSGYFYADRATIGNTSVYVSGDTITFETAPITIRWRYSTSVRNFTSTASNGLTLGNHAISGSPYGVISASSTTFTAGTSSTVSKTIDFKFTDTSNNEHTFTVTLELVYNGSTTITARWKMTSVSGLAVTQATAQNKNYSGIVDSTKNNLQNVDIYIDLDIGEAYSIDSSNNVVSLNNYVNIGGELPTLPPGNTTITYPTSITNFKITPRWWKI